MYDNNNTGTLNKNDRKELPNHPDYKGQITVEGVEYWVSGWVKTAQKGKNAGKSFLSLSLQPKDAPAPQSTNVGGDELAF